jgi:PST family polysaccharide transporter
LVRLLSPEDFGLIGMVVVFTGFARLFSDLGLGAALIQKQDLKRRYIDTVFWVNLGAGVLLTVFVMVAAPIVAYFYSEPILVPVTRVLAIDFTLSSLNIVQYSLLRKQLAFRRIFWIQALAVFVSGAAAVHMAFSGFGVWALVTQTLVFTTTTAIILWTIAKWHPRFVFEWQAIKDLLGFSGNYLGFNVLRYWTKNTDNLLIGKYIGSSALGIYGRAYGLMLMPVAQVNRILTQVMFPALASIQDDIRRVRQIYLQATRIIALASFPLMIGLFVVAESFVLLVYGPRWYAMVPILRILCLVGLLQSISTTAGWIYISQGRTDILFRWGLLVSVVRVTGFVIGLRWGLIGLSLSYLFTSYVILWYPSWRIPFGLIKLGFAEMVRNLAGIFLCAAGMGITVWLIGEILPIGWPDLTYLLVQVAVGMVIYGCLIHLFSLTAYHDVRSLMIERFMMMRQTKTAESHI